MTDVTQAGGAEDRVSHRMQQHVRIGMPVRTDR